MFFFLLFLTCICYSEGANLFSLNEKQRGFPKGFRVMLSEKHDFCLFEMDTSLEKARVSGGDWMPVSSISVWGCGGVEAMETQHRVKMWEAKEIIRRKQVSIVDVCLSHVYMYTHVCAFQIHEYKHVSVSEVLVDTCYCVPLPVCVSPCLSACTLTRLCCFTLRVCSQPNGVV